jgi:flap endonuclease-1
MGVDISSIIYGKEIEIRDLVGKRIAIDAFNTLYQFLSTIRQRDGTPLMDSNGKVTSHLTGIFYRTSNLMSSGIKLCYVFDGKPPEFKAVSESRRQRRDEARQRFEEARMRGDHEQARKYAQQSSRLTDDMVEETKKLLSAMGIPYIQAPSEGEAQAAHMCMQGDVHATASQDYDALVFGSTKLVRNLNITGKRKLPGKNVYKQVNPEIYTFQDVLSSLEITREQFINLAILVGTDYNPGGIKGIGPKKALKLVKEKTEPFKEVVWEFDIKPQAIADWFNKPDVIDKYELEWKGVDAEVVKGILCDGHGFSEERVDNTLAKITSTASQRSLSEF